MNSVVDAFVLLITDGHTTAVVGPFESREAAEAYSAQSGDDSEITKTVARLQSPHGIPVTC